jgi:hypothetical protein
VFRKCIMVMVDKKPSSKVLNKKLVLWKVYFCEQTRFHNIELCLWKRPTKGLYPTGRVSRKCLKNIFSHFPKQNTREAFHGIFRTFNSCRLDFPFFVFLSYQAVVGTHKHQVNISLEFPECWRMTGWISPFYRFFQAVGTCH